MTNNHARFTARHFRGWRSEDTWGVVGLCFQPGFPLVGALAVLPR
ncbi:MAG: hypothetical protein K0R27_743 [Xanthobacteraceae bacterium]|nr:hypothetical protein [Xanthobacteraceae bacterium]